MRRFAYNELGEAHPVVVTEEEILFTYWPYWTKEMLRAHKSPKMTTENCLDDFIVVNWAWEVTEPS